MADLSDATKTVYRYPIVEDDPAELGIQAVTQTVDESQQACYRLYLNGYIVSPFTATIVITGGSNYLDSQQETVLSVYASALPHEFCIDLDDDDVAEAEASISASIHSVSDTDIQTLSGNPAASVLVQDNEILQEVWIESVSAGIEGENVTFELTRSGTSVQIGEELSVSYKFEQVRNSFVPIIGTGNRTAVFAADATSATLTASTSDNDYVNATVAIRLRLLESDSFAYAFSADVDKPSAVEFDIANDDEYSVFVELATNQSSTIEEGESIELDLKRCILQDDGTVDCTNPLSIDGADSISEDLPLYITVDGNFFGTLPSTVHFGDFEQSATLTIDTIDDLIDELDGSITIKTVDPDSGRADQSVEITVEDNDTPPPPTVWIGNIQPPVEGENVTFELTRSGTSVQIGEELSVSYKFEQVRNSFVPIIGTGNRTAVFAADATSATLTASTSDNDYVNAAVAIRLRLLESDSLAYAFSADVDKPSAVEFDIANDDEYSVFVELATNQSSMIEEGESIELDLKRCILQDDGTVDCTNPLSIDGADAISEDLPLYITVDGNFFGTLPSTVHFGNFEQSATLTIDSIGDDIHEADGSIEIRTVDPDSGRADQSVTVTVEDDDRVQMEFSMPERVTEGDTVTITLTRSKSEIYAAVDVRADIEYHTKMFARGNRPDVIRILAFAVDETSKTISMTTDGDAVNEGDGKIEVSFSRPAAYEFPLRRGWTRVVDDDVPEVTLSVSATEVVEGDTVTWTLSRSDYVQRVLQVLPHYEWRHFFPPPDRDRHLSGEQTTFSDLNYAYGFISAGDTSNTWDECSFGLTGCNMGDVVGPLGGFMQRRIKPFPQDAFVGIPTETDTTFLPRYTVSNPDWVRVTIYNSAPSVTLQMDQEEVDEGESVSFTLNRLGGRPLALNSEMRINVDVSQVGDYLSSGEGTTVVTFPLNTTTTQFTLETVADVIYEEDGSITATLLPGALTGLTEDEYEFDTNVRDDGSYPHTGTTAVKSDDLEPVLSVEDASALESDGDMEFTVTLDRDAGQHVLVSYITTSYATDAAQLYHDFIPKTGSLTFQPGQTSKTVSVVIEDDNLFEDDETFTFLLSGPFFAKLGRDRATGTIVDDDTPKVTMAVASQSVAESDATLDVCATLTPVSTQPVLVTVTSFDGTASSVTDYTAIPASTKLTFPVSNKRQCQTIAITPDFLDESDETFTVTLSDVENADLGTQASTTVTIVDDDTRGVSVSTTTLDVEEGYDAGYTVVLTSRPTADVTVTPSRASGDTDVTVSGALTFTPLNWSTAQTVTVGAAQDADALDDAAVIGHAVSGGGDYAGVTAASVDVAVDDDETTSSGVTLSVDPDSIGEAAAATTITVTAALNSGTRGSRTPVVVSVGSGTATLGTDFEAAPGITFGLSPTRDTAFTITIPANAASQTGIFILTPTQDTMDEPNETVSVNGTTTVPGFSVTGAEVTITDDDAAPTVTLSLSDDSISEDGGIATVAASLDRSSSVATTVTVGVSPDTPATSSDYSLGSNPVLTIAAGSTASTGTVTVAGVDNDIDAADKTLQVEGDAVNGLGVTDPADVELTLEDDDARGVTVSATALDVGEGGDGSYTVVLTSEPTADVTVTPSRASGDTDVTVSGALTFTALNWSTAQTVTVSAAQDADALDDAAVIGHAVSGGDYAGVAAASVDVAVDDDETTSSGVTLSVDPDSIGEGAEATAITVTAALNGGTRGSATPVVVSVGSGTATSGTDFETVTGFTITIPANSASHTGTFSLSPTQDTLDERDETVSVNGTTTVPGFSVAGAEVEIADDDAAPSVTLSLSGTSIGEAGGIATVTASLDHASSESTAVTVSVSPDTPATSSDYSLSTNLVLTIAAESTASTGTVTIAGVDNDVDAADRTVQVKGDAVNGLGVTDPSDVELTLEDDDTRGVTVSATVLDVGEGGDGSYTVVLTSQPTADVTVTPSRASGDADVTVSGALTFTPLNWATAQAVTVGAGQDSDADDDGAVIGHAVSGGDYDGATAASVDVSVDDDETPSSGVTLTVVPDSIGEGAAATSITVTAALNGGTRGSATPVVVSVGSGTATSGTDFETVTGFTITIPANSASHTGTFSLSATQDTLDEPDETVSVNGTTTVPEFSVTGAEVEIADDDAEPGVTLSLSGTSIGEAGGIATVTASLDHASSESTAVTVSVSPDTPATSSDYSLSTNLVLTIAADSTASTGRVAITGVDNDVDSADGTVQVKGDAVNGLGVTDPADVELTLEDDDTRGVTVSATALDIGEGGDGSYTVVLTSQPTANVTVTPSRASGDTDVTVGGALTFTPLNWATAQTVTVGAAQDADALDDGAVIAHSVSGGDYGGVTAASVDVSVDDDETPSSGVTLSVNPDSIGEGAAATSITVTAALNGGTRGSATPVVVSVGSGTATSGTDFETVTGFTITIPPNTASHTGTFSLSPTQDTLDEPDETVSVNGTTTVPGFSVTGAEVEIADDDAAPGVTLSLSGTSISEAGGIATVTASLDHASSESTAVTVSVAPNTPATSSDYSPSANLVLTIAADSTASTGTVTIAGVDNDIDAADKTVTVKGDAENTLGVTDPADVELTLEDDDTRGVTVSATALDVGEGGDGSYTVVLTSQPTADVRVTPSRASGDTDVTVSGALTFTALNWATARTVTVSAGQDSDADDDSAVIAHAVSGGDYGGVTAASVDVSVDDDETPSSGITLTVAPGTLGEGAGATPVTVTATLNGGTRDEVTPVTVTVASGTAISGTDFETVSAFTITIPANAASHAGTFILVPSPDTMDEPNETLGVNGSTTVPGFSVTGAQVTIGDDDAAPRVTLSLSDASIGEDGGIATVTASLDHSSSVATTVTVSVSPDSPAGSSDYSLGSNLILTIAAGSTASTGTVTIAGVDNDIDAADKTLQVKGDAVNGLGVTDPADVELTLEDDDTRGVTVSATALDVDEGDAATYTVVLTSQPTADVTVTPSRESGDADVTVSGALTFTPSNWATARTVTVSAGQDSDADDDSAVIAHAVSGGDYGGVTAASVDVTVDDDETASSGVTLTVSPDTVAEDAGATPITVTATLNGGTRDEVTPVTVTVASGTAISGTDFETVSAFTITIPANAASHAGIFILTPTPDTMDEPDETLGVGGTSTVPGFSVTGAQVTIGDDDAAPRVTLSLSRTSISEDGGIATVTASLDHSSSVATTVTVGVSPDSPAGSSDYSLGSNLILTIAAGSTASTGTVTIAGVDNDIDAADKTLQVKGDAVNGLGVTDPADVELTLEDDDTRGVTVSATTLDVGEGGDGSYTVVLTSEPTANVTVTPSRESGDADVTVSGALTFTPLNWATARTVTVSAGQDSDADDDSAVIAHAVSGGDYGGVTAASVDVTVDDDETASSGVTLTVSPDTVAEDAGATPITVTATLNGGTRDEATPVTVTVASGTAISGTDFETVTGITITIPANAASHAGIFILTPTPDTMDEPDETLGVGGTSTVPGFSVTGAEVTITDDDAAPGVTLSLSRTSISEDGGIATVTASLDHSSSVATTVTVGVSPDSPAGSSDYSLGSNLILTIAAGSTASTGTVTIAGVDNDIDAADKTLQVKGDAVNGLGVTDPADVELTLEDDDTRGVTVSATTLDVGEGGDGSYTVVLTSEPTANVTVTPSRASGDADVTVSGALTFTPSNWATARTVTVSAGQDSDADDDSAVIGHAVSGGDYGGVTAASVDVSVDDDETPSSGITLTVVPGTLGEGAGATSITVTATLNGGTRDEVTPVTVTVASGTAISGTDFETVTGITITIPANAASHAGIFILTPTPDTMDEPDETLGVGGTSTVPGFSVTGAEVTITDDDAAPGVTLSLSRTSISEDGGIATVTASLDRSSSVATAVTVSVSPDSPATASDYSLSTNRVLTIAANATSSTGTVIIAGADNDIDAADKTLQVKGDAVNGLGVTDPADVELTLEDDDTRGVTVSATALDIGEGGDGSYTIVLTSQPTANVRVTPSRASGDADVTVGGALTFTPLNWATARTVTVSAGQDSDADDDSAVIGHAVSGGDYGGVTAASVDVSVDDDETPSSGITLTVAPDTLGEGAGATPITVTATLNGATRDEATPVTVTVASGTAISGTDFETVTGFTITIPANAAWHTGIFILTPSPDTMDEPDETLGVNGSTTVAGFSVTGAQVTIGDDDAAPRVTLSLSDASIGENGGIATVTASLDRSSSVTTTVAVSVSPDSPATSSGYSLGSSPVLTIAAGSTASTGTVTIAGVDNDIDAADKTLTVKGDAENTLGVTDPADVELTLEDDDTRGVTVSATALDVGEGDDAGYRVVLTSQPTADVTVTPSRESGDADVTVSGALTFNRFNWYMAQTVTVSAGQDSDALDEGAVIAHSVSGGDYGGVTVASVDVTVDDDETPSSGITLSVNPDSIGEGAAATSITVRATLNGGTRGSATPVVVSVGSGTATSGTDFETVTGFTITIPANSASHTGTFSLSPTQDTLDESDETVSVSGTTTVPGFSVTGAEVEIADDDAAPGVTLSLSGTSISEAGGIATVTASLDHASSRSTAVTVSVSPNTPATSSDYSPSANLVLTIAADSTASTGTVTIAGVDNDIDAADKTLTVKGDAENTLGVTDPADVELTLEDDDTRGVTVSATALDVGEGGDGSYTVVLTSEPTANVTVTPSRASGDTDVTVSGALTFTALNWATARTVTVSAGQDSDAVDDGAVIAHAVSGGDYGGVTAASVDVTVNDDETVSSGVTLSVNPDSIGEGAAATSITVRATLNGGTRGSATPVVVSVGSGTATSGTDFETVTGFTITIPANSASHTGTFSLSPTQDTLDEPDETVSVSGTTTVPGFSVTGAEVEIADDDAEPGVTLSLSGTSISEAGGIATVTASLDHASSRSTAVTVSVSPNTPATSSDYSPSANLVLTIAADSTASTGTVTIAGVDNDIDAADKTLTVKGDAENTLGVTDPADVELTLEDDDTRGVTVSATALDVGEGGDGATRLC